MGEMTLKEVSQLLLEWSDVPMGSVHIPTEYLRRMKAGVDAQLAKQTTPVGHFIETSTDHWEQASDRYVGEPRVVRLFAAPPIDDHPRPAVPDCDKAERMLSELVDKIVPGLDTGDLLADAVTASRALDASPTGEQAGDVVRELLAREYDAFGQPDSAVFVREGNDIPDDWLIHVTTALRIAEQAIAHPRPAVPEVALSEGDMFWTDDCEEYSLPSIDELVEGWVDGGTEDGTVVKVERAKRLPAVLVKVSVSDDSYGYELLSAAPESGGG